MINLPGVVPFVRIHSGNHSKTIFLCICIRKAVSGPKKPWQPQTWQDLTRFSPLDFSLLSPDFRGLVLLNCTYILEKKQKIQWRASSGDGAPKLQISVACRGRTCPDSNQKHFSNIVFICYAASSRLQRTTVSASAARNEFQNNFCDNVCICICYETHNSFDVFQGSYPAEARKWNFSPFSLPKVSWNLAWNLNYFGEIFRATFSRVWACEGNFHQKFTSKTVWSALFSVCNLEDRNLLKLRSLDSSCPFLLSDNSQYLGTMNPNAPNARIARLK